VTVLSEKVPTVSQSPIFSVTRSSPGRPACGLSARLELLRGMKSVPWERETLSLGVDLMSTKILLLC